MIKGNSSSNIYYEIIYKDLFGGFVNKQIEIVFWKGNKKYFTNFTTGCLFLKEDIVVLNLYYPMCMAFENEI